MMPRSSSVSPYIMLSSSSMPTQGGAFASAARSEPKPTQQSHLALGRADARRSLGTLAAPLTQRSLAGAVFSGLPQPNAPARVDRQSTENTGGTVCLACVSPPFVPAPFSSGIGRHCPVCQRAVWPAFPARCMGHLLRLCSSGSSPPFRILFSPEKRDRPVEQIAALGSCARSAAPVDATQSVADGHATTSPKSGRRT